MLTFEKENNVSQDHIVDQRILELINQSNRDYIAPDCSPLHLDDWKKSFNSWESMKHLGLQLRFIPPYASLIVINPLTNKHRGGRGQDAVNGAIISGALDGAIATIGFTHFPDNICGTIQLSINILRPVYGDSMYAYGAGIKRNKQFVFIEAELFDSNWKKCATATGIVGASNKKR